MQVNQWVYQLELMKQFIMKQKKVASAEFRSVPNQIEYWAKLGKCALDNPRFTPLCQTSINMLFFQAHLVFRDKHENSH